MFAFIIATKHREGHFLIHSELRSPLYVETVVGNKVTKQRADISDSYDAYARGDEQCYGQS